MDEEIEKIDDPLVEIHYDDYPVYFVPLSALKKADALKMPDGVFVDLRRAGIEYSFACTPCRYRLIGADPEDERLGKLPLLKIVEVKRKPS